MKDIQSTQNKLAFALKPISKLYAQFMHLRAKAYAKNFCKSWQPPIPCISVGNIACGGTGKTPLCAWLLNWSLGKRLNPVLLTRGYRSSPPRLPFLVDPQSSPLEAGDEPLLLASTYPQAKIIIDPKRKRSGPWAMQKCSPDLFILDDGFQHLAIKRHLNLVLLSPYDLDQGWNRVLPLGRWREGQQALKRADAFLVNTFGLPASKLEAIAKSRLGKMNKPVFAFRLKAQNLMHVLTGQIRFSAGRTPYILVTGLANPEKVSRTCRRLLGYSPKKHLVYPDHHQFTPRDMKKICQEAQKYKSWIACTPKDAIKMEDFAPENLWTLDLKLEFLQFDFSEPVFSLWLEKKLQAVLN